jgi:long-chain fatty acid transport protein
MRKMKAILIGVMSLVLLSSLAWANGLNLNSLGSRAQAMGGAFVALADDFSAIFWNPAGMGFFKTMQVGGYGTLIMPSGTYTLTVPVLGEVVNASTQHKAYPGGMAAFYYPITPELVAGIGVYTPSGLGSSWNGSDLAFLNTPYATTYDWSSKIGMITIAPGVAYKVSDSISVGATLNINYAMFDVNQWAKTAVLPSPPYPPGTIFNLGQYAEDDNGWGIGGTFGVLVKPIDKLSLGLTVKTPSKITLKGTASLSGFPLLGLPGSSDVSRDITWPLLIQGGVAFKPMDKLTIVADLQWTEWSTIDKITSVYADTLWASEMAGRDVIYLNWKDALQIRAGAEYKITDAVAVRAGYMHDPAPAPITTMNILLPSYDFDTITAGVGYTSGGLQFDVGLEYLMGTSRDLAYLTWALDPVTYGNAMPGHFGMNIVVPSVSVSYKF